MGITTSLVAGGLELQLWQEAGRALRLDWFGRSSERNPALVLRPYLEAVLQRAKESGSGVELHFEQMDFFNSSTVTVLIHFLREARSQGTALTLFYDGERRWQALSFDALKGLALPDGLLEICAAKPATLGA